MSARSNTGIREDELARTIAQRKAALRNGPRAPRRRSERSAFSETKSQRALRGAQLTGRQDMERGVTSRARKTITGRETVADPRYGGRPGQEHSKWQPPRPARPRA